MPTVGQRNVLCTRDLCRICMGGSVSFVESFEVATYSAIVKVDCATK